MIVKLAGVSVDVKTQIGEAYSENAAFHASQLDRFTEIVRELPANPIIFDVGSNMGLTAIAAAIARPDARIFAFEPSPATVWLLRYNTRRFTNVEVIHAAVSDNPGTLRFHPSAFSAGAHVISESHIVEGIKSILVPAITIDNFASEKNIVPSFIKIDVEGHEPEVLAGARHVLKSYPKIYMEFNSWTLNAFAGHSPASFAKCLFQIFDIEGRTSPLDFLHSNMIQDGCVSNLTMRLKPGASIPSLAEMSGYESHVAATHAMEHQFFAIKSSTSWKLTAPLRKLMHVVRRQRAS